ETPGAAHLVRLDALLRHEAGQPLAPLGQRCADIRPRIDALGELEVVEPAEQAQGQIPVGLGLDLGHERLLGELAAKARVERRAAVAVRGLAEEDLGLAVQLSAESGFAGPEPEAPTAASADFAWSTISLNASGSDTARSASTLRSSSTPAFRQP